MQYEHLKLKNQLCFSVYAASLLIKREYQPLLDQLKITYPQYLVLLVLWESDDLSVNEIARKLFLNTNTVTPLIKRMEAQGLLTRRRSEQDERKVIVSLTPIGSQMQDQAAAIPHGLISQLHSNSLTLDDLQSLKEKLSALTDHLSARQG